MIKGATMTPAREKEIREFLLVDIVRLPRRSMHDPRQYRVGELPTLDKGYSKALDIVTELLAELAELRKVREAAAVVDSEYDLPACGPCIASM